jgi:hypothetical protein
MIVAVDLVRAEWRGRAARGPHFGGCNGCGERTLVARRERCQLFLCLGCFGRTPHGRAAVARAARDSEGIAA